MEEMGGVYQYLCFDIYDYSMGKYSFSLTSLVVYGICLRTHHIISLLQEVSLNEFYMYGKLEATILTWYGFRLVASILHYMF